MAVNLFAKVDRSKVDSLPFIEGSYPFGYRDNQNVNRLGVIYEITAESMGKLRKLIKGKEEGKIGKKDRVFVLSGCKIPQFKIKEFCKGVGAVMVNDVEEATVVVGNSKVIQTDNSRYWKTESISMAFSTDYWEVKEFKKETFLPDSVLLDYYSSSDKLEKARFTVSAASYDSNNITKGSERYMYALTPYLARVVYEILSRRLQVISDTCLYEQLPTSSKLDRSLCESLMMMMDSHDEENRVTAHEILANSDYKDAELYLYIIARAHYYQLNGSRFKNVKLFVKESELRSYNGISEESFLRKKADLGQLTKEMLEMVLPLVGEKVENQIKGRVDSRIFDIKMELKPEFADLIPGHQFDKTVERKNT